MAKRKRAAKKAGRKSTPAKRSAGTKRAAKGRVAAKAAKRGAKRRVAKKALKVAKKALKKAPKRVVAKKAARKIPKKAPAPMTPAAPAPVATTAPAPRKAAKKAAAPGTERPSIPSSLGLDQHSSSAKSGRKVQREQLKAHTETSPAITGGDVDANWEGAYSSGDEAPGGDNPTPDQDRVDDIGHALGVEYEDNEELKGAEKITERDKHRWELNPASSDDYRSRS